MADGVLKKYEIQITANTDELEKSLKQAEQIVKGFSKNSGADKSLAGQFDSVRDSISQVTTDLNSLKSVVSSNSGALTKLSKSTKDNYDAMAKSITENVNEINNKMKTMSDNMANLFQTNITDSLKTQLTGVSDSINNVLDQYKDFTKVLKDYSNGIIDSDAIAGLANSLSGKNNDVTKAQQEQLDNWKKFRKNLQEQLEDISAIYNEANNGLNMKEFASGGKWKISDYVDRIDELQELSAKMENFVRDYEANIKAISKTGGVSQLFADAGFSDISPSQLKSVQKKLANTITGFLNKTGQTGTSKDSGKIEIGVQLADSGDITKLKSELKTHVIGELQKEADANKVQIKYEMVDADGKKLSATDTLNNLKMSLTADTSAIMDAVKLAVDSVNADLQGESAPKLKLGVELNKDSVNSELNKGTSLNLGNIKADLTDSIGKLNINTDGLATEATLSSILSTLNTIGQKAFGEHWSKVSNNKGDKKFAVPSTEDERHYINYKKILGFDPATSELTAAGRSRLETVRKARVNAAYGYMQEEDVKNIFKSIVKSETLDEALGTLRSSQYYKRFVPKNEYDDKGNLISNKNYAAFGDHNQSLGTWHNELEEYLTAIYNKYHSDIDTLNQLKDQLFNGKTITLGMDTTNAKYSSKNWRTVFEKGFGKVLTLDDTKENTVSWQDVVIGQLKQEQASNSKGIGRKKFLAPRQDLIAQKMASNPKMSKTAAEEAVISEYYGDKISNVRGSQYFTKEYQEIFEKAFKRMASGIETAAKRMDFSDDREINNAIKDEWNIKKWQASYHSQQDLGKRRKNANYQTMYPGEAPAKKGEDTNFNQNWGGALLQKDKKKNGGQPDTYVARKHTALNEYEGQRNVLDALAPLQEETQEAYANEQRNTEQLEAQIKIRERINQLIQEGKKDTAEYQALMDSIVISEEELKTKLDPQKIQRSIDKLETKKRTDPTSWSSDDDLMLARHKQDYEFAKKYKMYDTSTVTNRMSSLTGLSVGEVNDFASTYYARMSKTATTEQDARFKELANKFANNKGIKHLDELSQNDYQALMSGLTQLGSEGEIGRLNASIASLDAELEEIKNKLNFTGLTEKEKSDLNVRLGLKEDERNSLEEQKKNVIKNFTFSHDNDEFLAYALNTTYLEGAKAQSNRRKNSIVSEYQHAALAEIMGDGTSAHPGWYMPYTDDESYRRDLIRREELKAENLYYSGMGTVKHGYEPMKNGGYSSRYGTYTDYSGLTQEESGRWRHNLREISTIENRIAQYEAYKKFSDPNFDPTDVLFEDEETRKKYYNKKNAKHNFPEVKSTQLDLLRQDPQILKLQEMVDNVEKFQTDYSRYNELVSKRSNSTDADFLKSTDKEFKALDKKFKGMSQDDYEKDLEQRMQIAENYRDSIKDDIDKKIDVAANQMVIDDANYYLGAYRKDMRKINENLKESQMYGTGKYGVEGKDSRLYKRDIRTVNNTRSIYNKISDNGEAQTSFEKAINQRNAAQTDIDNIVNAVKENNNISKDVIDAFGDISKFRSKVKNAQNNLNEAELELNDIFGDKKTFKDYDEFVKEARKVHLVTGNENDVNDLSWGVRDSALGDDASTEAVAELISKYRLGVSKDSALSILNKIKTYRNDRNVNYNKMSSAQRLLRNATRSRDKNGTPFVSEELIDQYLDAQERKEDAEYTIAQANQSVSWQKIDKLRKQQTAVHNIPQVVDSFNNMLATLPSDMQDSIRSNINKLTEARLAKSKNRNTESQAYKNADKDENAAYKALRRQRDKLSNDDREKYDRIYSNLVTTQTNSGFYFSIDDNTDALKAQNQIKDSMKQLPEAINAVEDAAFERLQQLDVEIGELEKKITATPKNSVEYNRLNKQMNTLQRDRDGLAVKYESEIDGLTEILQNASKNGSVEELQKIQDKANNLPSELLQSAAGSNLIALTQSIMDNQAKLTRVDNQSDSLLAYSKSLEEQEKALYEGQKRPSVKDARKQSHVQRIKDALISNWANIFHRNQEDEYMKMLDSGKVEQKNVISRKDKLALVENTENNNQKAVTDSKEEEQRINEEANKLALAPIARSQYYQNKIDNIQQKQTQIAERKKVLAENRDVISAEQNGSVRKFWEDYYRDTKSEYDSRFTDLSWIGNSYSRGKQTGSKDIVRDGQQIGIVDAFAMENNIPSIISDMINDMMGSENTKSLTSDDEKMLLSLITRFKSGLVSGEFSDPDDILGRFVHVGNQNSELFNKTGITLNDYYEYMKKKYSSPMEISKEQLDSRDNVLEYLNGNIKDESSLLISESNKLGEELFNAIIEKARADVDAVIDSLPGENEARSSDYYSKKTRQVDKIVKALPDDYNYDYAVKDKNGKIIGKGNYKDDLLAKKDKIQERKNLGANISDYEYFKRDFYASTRNGLNAYASANPRPNWTMQEILKAYRVDTAQEELQKLYEQQDSNTRDIELLQNDTEKKRDELKDAINDYAGGNKDAETILKKYGIKHYGDRKEADNALLQINKTELADSIKILQGKTGTDVDIFAQKILSTNNKRRDLESEINKAVSDYKKDNTDASAKKILDKYGIKDVNNQDEVSNILKGAVARLNEKELSSAVKKLYSTELQGKSDQEISDFIQKISTISSSGLFRDWQAQIGTSIKNYEQWLNSEEVTGKQSAKAPGDKGYLWVGSKIDKGGKYISPITGRYTDVDHEDERNANVDHDKLLSRMYPRGTGRSLTVSESRAKIAQDKETADAIYNEIQAAHERSVKKSSAPTNQSQLTHGVFTDEEYDAKTAYNKALGELKKAQTNGAVSSVIDQLRDALNKAQAEVQKYSTLTYNKNGYVRLTDEAYAERRNLPVYDFINQTIKNDDYQAPKSNAPTYSETPWVEGLATEDTLRQIYNAITEGNRILGAGEDRFITHEGDELRSQRGYGNTTITNGSETPRSGRKGQNEQIPANAVYIDNAYGKKIPYLNTKGNKKKGIAPQTEQDALAIVNSLSDDDLLHLVSYGDNGNQQGTLAHYLSYLLNSKNTNIPGMLNAQQIDAIAQKAGLKLGKDKKYHVSEKRADSSKKQSNPTPPNPQPQPNPNPTPKPNNNNNPPTPPTPPQPNPNNPQPQPNPNNPNPKKKKQKPTPPIKNDHEYDDSTYHIKDLVKKNTDAWLKDERDKYNKEWELASEVQTQDAYSRLNGTTLTYKHYDKDKQDYEYKTFKFGLKTEEKNGKERVIAAELPGNNKLPGTSKQTQAEMYKNLHTLAQQYSDAQDIAAFTQDQSYIDDWKRARQEYYDYKQYIEDSGLAKPKLGTASDKIVNELDDEDSIAAYFRNLIENAYGKNSASMRVARGIAYDSDQADLSASVKRLNDAMGYLDGIVQLGIVSQDFADKLKTEANNAYADVTRTAADKSTAEQKKAYKETGTNYGYQNGYMAVRDSNGKLVSGEKWAALSQDEQDAILDRDYTNALEQDKNRTSKNEAEFTKKLERLAKLRTKQATTGALSQKELNEVADADNLSLYVKELDEIQVKLDRINELENTNGKDHSTWPIEEAQEYDDIIADIQAKFKVDKNNPNPFLENNILYSGLQNNDGYNINRKYIDAYINTNKNASELLVSNSLKKRFSELDDNDDDNELATYTQYAQQKIDGLKNEYRDLLNTPIDVFNNGEIVKRVTELKELEIQLDQVASAENKVVSPSTLSKMSNNFENWLANNSKVIVKYKSEVEEFRTALADTTQSNSSANMLNSGINDFMTNVTKAGDAGKTFLDQIGSRMSNLLVYLSSFVQFYDIIRYFQQGISVVKEYDDAMTDLKKVAQGTTEQIESFGKESYSIADSIGSTNTAVIQAATEWARLGKDMSSAKDLAKASTVYANVGELDATTATQDLISAMNAFSIADEDAMSVVDKMNIVGNNYAVSSAQLGEILEKSSASLAVSGDDIDHVIAMGAAMNETLQDSSTVGSTLKIVGLRLRGTKTEIEEMGEETDGMAESTSKLRSDILALTNVDGKGGFDIMKNNKEYKTTYEIIKGIADVWDDMSQIDQSALLEEIAGKNRAQGAAALIANFDTAEKALQDSLNAEGSAMQENNAYMESISARQAKLSNATNEFWNGLVDKDVVVFFADLGTKIVELATDFGSLKTVITLVVAALGGIKPMLQGQGLFKTRYNENGKGSFIPQFNEANSGVSFVKRLFSGNETSERPQYASEDTVKAYAQTYMTHQYDSTNLSKHMKWISNKSASDDPNGLTEHFVNWEKEQASKGVKFENTEQAWTSYKKNIQATNEQLEAYSVKTISAKAATVALNIATTALASVAFTMIVGAITDVISYVASYDKSLREAASSASTAYKESCDSIDEYAERVKSDYETINDSSSSIEDVANARLDLMTVQTELIDKFGDEEGAINNITDALNNQTTAWQDMKDAAWESQKSSFISDNKPKGILQNIGSFFKSIGSGIANILSGGQSATYQANDPTGNLASQMEHQKISSSKVFGAFGSDYYTYSSEMQKAIQGVITDLGIGGNTGNVTYASAYDIIDKLKKAKETTSIANPDELAEFQNGMDNIIADYQAIISEQGDFYDQLVLNDRILKNDEVAKYYNNLEEAYESYTEAYSNGGDVNSALEDFSTEFTNLKNSDLYKTDSGVKQYVDKLYTGIQLEANKHQFELKFNDDESKTKDKVEEALNAIRNGMSNSTKILTKDYISGLDDAVDGVAELKEVAEESNLELDTLLSKLQDMGEIKTSAYQELAKSISTEKLDKLTNDQISEIYGGTNSYKDFLKKSLGEAYGGRQIFDMIYGDDSKFTDYQRGWMATSEDISEIYKNLDSGTPIERMNKAIEEAGKTTEVLQYRLSKTTSNISDLTDGSTALSSALDETNSNGYISTDTLTDLNSKIEDTSDLLIATVDGIKLDSDAMDEYIDTQAKDKTEELDNIYEGYLEKLVNAKKDLETLEDASEEVNSTNGELSDGLYTLTDGTTVTADTIESLTAVQNENVKSTEKQIQTISSQMSVLKELTSAYNKYIKATSTKNQGDRFDTLTSSYEATKKLYDNGQYYTDDVMQFTKLFGNPDTTKGLNQNSSRADVQSAAKAAMANYKKYMTDDAKGPTAMYQNLYNLLQKNNGTINGASFIKDSDGNILGIDVNDIEKAANALNVTGDILEITMEKLQEYQGNDIWSYTGIDKTTEDIINDINKANQVISENTKKTEENSDAKDQNKQSTEKIADSISDEVKNAIESKKQAAADEVAKTAAEEANTKLDTLVNAQVEVGANFSQEDYDAVLQKAIDLKLEMEKALSSNDDTGYNSALESFNQLFEEHGDIFGDSKDATKNIILTADISSYLTQTGTVEDEQTKIENWFDKTFTLNVDTTSAGQKLANISSYYSTVKNAIEKNPIEVKVNTGTTGIMFPSTEDGDAEKNDTDQHKVGADGGIALADGKMNDMTPGTTLVGELGQELVVDRSTGEWRTVGDNGAEFTNIDKGDIVFNANQTKALLSSGHINGRGKALASGQNNYDEKVIQELLDEAHENKWPGTANLTREQLIAEIDKGFSGNLNTQTRQIFLPGDGTYQTFYGASATIGNKNIAYSPFLQNGKGVGIADKLDEETIFWYLDQIVGMSDGTESDILRLDRIGIDDGDTHISRLISGVFDLDQGDLAEYTSEITHYVGQYFDRTGKNRYYNEWQQARADGQNNYDEKVIEEILAEAHRNGWDETAALQVHTLKSFIEKGKFGNIDPSVRQVQINSDGSYSTFLGACDYFGDKAISYSLMNQDGKGEGQVDELESDYVRNYIQQLVDMSDGTADDILRLDRIGITDTLDDGSSYYIHDLISGVYDKENGWQAELDSEILHYIGQYYDRTGQNPYYNAVFGNARADGQNNDLVGELGPEIRVHNGKWDLLGQNGAEFTNIDSSDMVIPADQTAKILSGKSYAEGKAYPGGSGVAGNLDLTGTATTNETEKATKENTKATKENTKATKEETKQEYNWIETLSDSIEHKRDVTSELEASSEWNSYEARISGYRKMIEYDKQELQTWNEGVKKYYTELQEKYDAIRTAFGDDTETAEHYIRLIQNGSLGDDWQTAIKQAQDKANGESSDAAQKTYTKQTNAISEAQTWMSNLQTAENNQIKWLKQQHEDLKSIYDLQLEQNKALISAIDSEISEMQTQIEMKDTTGEIVTTGAYEDLIAATDDKIAEYYNQIEILQNELDELGDAEDSAEYAEIQASIADCNAQILECEKSQAEWNETIKQLPITHIESYIENIKTAQSDLNDYISELEATGQKVTADIVKQQMELEQLIAEQYKNELSKVEENLNTYTPGSSKWNEAFTNLQSLDDEISSIVQNMIGFNKTLLQIPVDKLSDVSDEISSISTGLTAVQDDNLSVINAAIDTITRNAEELVEPLQDQLDLLNRESEVRSDILDVETAAYNLAKKMNQKTVQVVQNGKLVYQSDADDVREAQNDLQTAKDNAKKNELQREIDKINDDADDAKEKWEKIQTDTEYQTSVEEAAKLAGMSVDEFRNRVLTGNDEDLYNTTKNSYETTAEQQTAVEEISDTLSTITTLIEEINTKYLANELTADQAKAMVEQLINAGKDGLTGQEELNNRLNIEQQESADSAVQSAKDAIANTTEEYNDIVQQTVDNTTIIAEYQKKETELAQEIKDELEKAKEAYQNTVEAENTHGSYSSSSKSSSGGSSSSSDDGEWTKPYYVRNMTVNEYFDKVDSDSSSGGHSDSSNYTSSKSSSSSSSSSSSGGPGVNLHYADGIENGTISLGANTADEKFRILQDFATQGFKASEVPVIADLGEAVLNPRQQSNILSAINQSAATGMVAGASMRSVSPVINISLGDMTLPNVTNGSEFAQTLSQTIEPTMNQYFSKFFK